MTQSNFSNFFLLKILINIHLRNEFDFWKVHGIMNTSGFTYFGLHLLCKRPEVFMIP